MSNQRYTGKVAVITGVNDRGIGAATADRLAQEGANLSILWQEEPVRLLKKLEKYHVQVLSLECDVTSESDVQSTFNSITSEFGQIDVLINNAGVDHSGRFSETKDDDWQHVIDVNLTGAMRVIREALPHISRDGGAIVNIASVLGIAGCAGFPAYSATKAGLVGLTQSLAAELAPSGIRAVCVAPALVKTPMLKKYLKSFDEDFLAELQRSHPLGIGSPQDVAAAISFLASAEARWITGVTLPLGWASSFPLPAQMFLGNSEPAPRSLEIDRYRDQSLTESSSSQRRTG